ncbi:MAG: hypothetical protein WDN25_04045 [Acetobacteraceae bacterium]
MGLTTTALRSVARRTNVELRQVRSAKGRDMTITDAKRRPSADVVLRQISKLVYQANSLMELRPPATGPVAASQYRAVQQRLEEMARCAGRLAQAAES